MAEQRRHKRGRPPEPLPDGVTPEELARAIMQAPPKKKWRYVAEHERQQQAKKAAAEGRDD